MWYIWNLNLLRLRIYNPAIYFVKGLDPFRRLKIKRSSFSEPGTVLSPLSNLVFISKAYSINRWYSNLCQVTVGAGSGHGDGLNPGPDSLWTSGSKFPLNSTFLYFEISYPKTRQKNYSCLELIDALLVAEDKVQFHTLQEGARSLPRRGLIHIKFIIPI